MNENEIKEFLKKRREEQKTKDHLDDLMKTFKDSDFNQDLKSESYWTDEQKITWLYAEKNSECFYCGITTQTYYLKKGKKLFACTSCGSLIKNQDS